MEIQDFKNHFKEFTSYFGEVSQEKAIIYYEHLKHLSVDKFKNALEHLIKTYKYNNVPKVADILEAVNGDLDEQAESALNIALETMLSLGSYHSVCFEDKRLNAVIKSFGGWIAFGNCSFYGESVETAVNRKRFLEAYKTLKPLDISHFKGIFEKENSYNGVLNENESPVYLINKSGKSKQISLKERNQMLTLANKNNPLMLLKNAMAGKIKTL